MSNTFPDYIPTIQGIEGYDNFTQEQKTHILKGYISEMSKWRNETGNPFSDQEARELGDFATIEANNIRFGFDQEQLNDLFEASSRGVNIADKVTDKFGPSDELVNFWRAGNKSFFHMARDFGDLVSRSFGDPTDVAEAQAASLEADLELPTREGASEFVGTVAGSLVPNMVAMGVAFGAANVASAPLISNIANLSVLGFMGGSSAETGIKKGEVEAFMRGEDFAMDNKAATALGYASSEIALEYLRLKSLTRAFGRIGSMAGKNSDELVNAMGKGVRDMEDDVAVRLGRAANEGRVAFGREFGKILVGQSTLEGIQEAGTEVGQILTDILFTPLDEITPTEVAHQVGQAALGGAIGGLFLGVPIATAGAVVGSQDKFRVSLAMHDLRNEVKQKRDRGLIVDDAGTEFPEGASTPLIGPFKYAEAESPITKRLDEFKVALKSLPLKEDPNLTAEENAQKLTERNEGYDSLRAVEGEEGSVLDALQKLIDPIGLNALFVDEAPGVTEARLVNGLALPGASNNILINIRAKNPLDYVIGHEAFHTLKGRFGSQNRLATEIENLIDIAGPQFQAQRQKIVDIRADQSLNEAQQGELIEEVAADFFGEAFLTDVFWEGIAERTRETGDLNLFQKLIESAVGVARRFLVSVGQSDVTPATKTLFKNYERAMETAIELYGEAANQTRDSNFTKSQGMTPSEMQIAFRNELHGTLDAMDVSGLKKTKETTGSKPTPLSKQPSSQFAKVPGVRETQAQNVDVSDAAREAQSVDELDLSARTPEQILQVIRLTESQAENAQITRQEQLNILEDLNSRATEVPGQDQLTPEVREVLDEALREARLIDSVGLENEQEVRRFREQSLPVPADINEAELQDRLRLSLVDQRHLEFKELRKGQLPNLTHPETYRKQQKRIAAAVPGYAAIARHLTKAERKKLRVDTAKTLVDLFKELPQTEEFAAVALAGSAKRGWYEQSANALLEIFGQDAPRFAALLAATSPQVSVEVNLANALRIWKAWQKSDRTTSHSEIAFIMAKNVEKSPLESRSKSTLDKIPEKTEDLFGITVLPSSDKNVLIKNIREALTPNQIDRVSVLDAWLNNSIRALTTHEPEGIVLSGPKVNSFMLNLLGHTQEVTNDTWMANFALVEQKILSGSGISVDGTDPGKGPRYLAMSAKIRAGATRLSKITGEEWTPAEVQETVWSWAKTLYELQDRKGETRDAAQILDSGELTDKVIGETPAFAELLNDEQYRQILVEAGYGEQLQRLAEVTRRGDGRDSAESKRKAEATHGASFARHVRRAAKRLALLRSQKIAKKNTPLESPTTARFSLVNAGLSLERPGARPTREQQLEAIVGLTTSMTGQPGVNSVKVKDTEGLYGDDVERSLDIELDVTEVFTPEVFVAQTANMAQVADQDSAFVSMRLTGSFDNANARPGMSIMFKKPLPLAEVSKIREEFQKRDLDGFTMVADPNLVLGEKGAEQFAGIRFEYIPEFDHMFNGIDLSKMDSIIETKAKDLQKVAETLEATDNIESVEATWHDTLVMHRETYDDYREADVGETPGLDGERAWFGLPIREAIERSDRRIEDIQRDTQPQGARASLVGQNTPVTRTPGSSVQQSSDVLARLAETRELVLADRSKNAGWAHMERMWSQRPGTGDTFGISLIDRFRTGFTDKLRIAEMAIQYAKHLSPNTVLPGADPALLMRLFSSVNATVEEMFDNGVMVAGTTNRRATGGGINWLLKDLDTTSNESLNLDMKNVALMMIAERVIEKNTQTDVGEVANMTELKAKSVLADLKTDPKKFEKYQKAAIKYRKWADATMQYAVDQGRMSQAQFDWVKSRNMQYVAMQRVQLMKDGDEIVVATPMAGGKLGNVAEPIKKFKGGSTKKVQDVYESLLSNTHRIIKEADRNAVMGGIVNMMGGIEGEENQKKIADVGERVPFKGSTDNTLVIFNKGVPERWRFQSDVLKSLKGLYDIAPLPWIARILPTIFRNSITYSPPFIVRNIIRDTQHRLTVTEGTVGAGLASTFKKFTRMEMDLLRRFGGDQAGYYLHDRVHYARALNAAIKDLAGDKKSIVALPSKLGGFAWGKYKATVEGSERFNRLREFEAAFKEAKPALVAQLKAEGTLTNSEIQDQAEYNAYIVAAAKTRGLMDFAVSGTIIRVINQVLPFTNAHIQGLRRTLKTMRKSEGGVGIKAFGARWALMALLPSLLVRSLAAANGSDEEYEAMPDYLKDLFWNIKLSPDLWLRIPKNYEIGVLTSGVERAVSKVVYGNKDAFQGYLGSVQKTLTPIDEASMLGPLKAFGEAMFNYDSFRDKQIVPWYEAKKDIDLRKGTENASRLGRFGQQIMQMVGLDEYGGKVGQTFSDSRIIDHVIRGQFGTLGSMAMTLSGVDESQKTRPVVGAFAGILTNSPAYGSRDVRWVFNIAEERGISKNNRALKPLMRALTDLFDNGDTPEKRDRMSAKVREVAASTRGRLERMKKDNIGFFKD